MLAPTERALQHLLLLSDSENAENCIVLGVQMLSNCVTGRDDILDTVWPHWSLESTLIGSLLHSNHNNVVESTLILVQNCTRNSIQRSRLLLENQQGVIILELIIQKSFLSEECHEFWCKIFNTVKL